MGSTIGGGVSTHSNCVFAVADALDITLHQVGKGYKGFASRKYNIGGFWSFSEDTVVASDSTADSMLSFFVRFTGELWGYMISSSKGLWLVLVDGGRAKLRVGATAEVGTGSIVSTLEKLSGSAMEGYVYNEQSRAWESFDVMGSVKRVQKVQDA